MKDSLVSATGLYKSFGVGEQKEEVIRGVDLEIKRGDFVILFGPSGSGKSTLLNVLIGLESPTSGTVWIGKRDLASLNEDERANLRAQTFGVVYQQPIWIKSLSVLENVALSLLLQGEEYGTALEKAQYCLQTVEMQQYGKKKPMELSGGQQQRVGLARALITNPQALVLDEPTGSLDTAAADRIFSLLQDLQIKSGVSIIMVTHNPVYLTFASRVILIQDGKISDGKHLKHTS